MNGWTHSFTALTSLLLAVSGSARAHADAAQPDRYELRLDLQPDQQQMTVAGALYAPRSAIDENTLSLQLTSLIEHVDFFVPGETLEHVERAGAGSDITWKLYFKDNPASSENVKIEFKYTFDDDFAPQFRIESAGSFAGGFGELWYPQRDFSIKNTGRITIVTSRGHKAIATGRLKKSRNRRGLSEFVFHVDTPSKFSFAAGAYVVKKTNKKPPFSIYALSASKNFDIMFDVGAALQNYFTGKFGAPLHPEMALVEVNFESRVLGTSEAGFILSDDSKFHSPDFLYWAHELAHQWWGQTISAENSAPGAMMASEGLAQYSAMMALHDMISPAAASTLRKNGLGRPRDGSESYFELLKENQTRAIVGRKPTTQEEILMQHQLANSKGAFVMFMLGEHVGQERLLAALGDILKDRRGDRLKWSEFENLLEENLTEDLGWFFDQWLRRPGAPVFSLCWQMIGDRLEGIIYQTGPYYRVQIELKFESADPRPQTFTEIIETAGIETHFRIAPPFEPASAVLDPDFKILHRKAAQYCE